MAENANHHFVPQYYFRLFTDGRPYISVYLTTRRQIIARAPIKGQCARHKFYGTAAVEAILSTLEAQHAITLKALVRAGSDRDTRDLPPDHFPFLLQAVALQRARTALEVDKESVATNALVLELFKEHTLNTLPLAEAEAIVGAIERGEVLITEDPTQKVLKQIALFLDSSTLLLDLLPRILINHTDYPFVFSDSPVIFYNTYLRNVKDRGVLGLQTPGLQVFYPLTPSLQLMLIDPHVYTGSFHQSMFLDIVNRSDVSQLNALQVHHSDSAIYFADFQHAEYVASLCKMHGHIVRKPSGVFRRRSDLLVDGVFPESPLFQMFEPQLSHQLSLSFVDCDPLPHDQFVFRRRSPELVEEHRRTHSHLYPEEG